ncbi:MAG TPA: hypothetical protein VGQ42_17830 [Candidatus Dormibacteraeota bacterium]|nr:hypothetical protein [Candidatus Dormibacteraeota bacterium]
MHPTPRRPPLFSGPPRQRVLAAMCLAFGLLTVWPLLAWVYGLGSFAVWYWALAVPGLLFITGLAVVLRRTGAYPDLHVAIVAGALGGIVGTIAYDLVRAPFLALGLRLFAPIDSYGLFILDASHSSPLTEFTGWTYNVANGVGFGVAYAVIGLGRRWWLAIPWALWLESMTLITPYAGSYGIAGHPDLVAIAYFGHVAYGTPLGIIVRQAAHWRSRDDAPVPVSWAVAAVAAILLVWHQPWSIPASVGAAESLRPQPASLVESGKFVPEWVRVPAGGCLLLANHDAATYTLSGVTGAGRGQPLAASSQGRYCFAGAGVKRVQLNGVPYSGGFVIVDPALHP